MNSSNLLLTGGSGRLGIMLLKRLEQEKFRVAVLSRKLPLDQPSTTIYIKADLSDLRSVHSLLTGFDIVVHLASNPRNASGVDVEGTKNLLQAIERSSLKHFIYISIVGVDRISYDYYKHKLKAEAIVHNSGYPYTIVRFTQFHDFVYDMILHVDRTSNVLTVPVGLSFQSIDIADACEEILKLVVQGPINDIVEIGGPEIMTTETMAATLQQEMQPALQIQLKHELNELQLAFTQGFNLVPDRKTGSVTWKDFLKTKKKSEIG